MKVRPFGRLVSLWDKLMSGGIPDHEDAEFRRRMRVSNLTAVLLILFGSIWTLNYLHIGKWMLGSVST